MKKFTLYILTAFSLMGLTTSCNDFGDVNNDPMNLNPGVVETALHGHDVFVAQLTEYQFSTMTFDSRYREVRNIRILYFILLGDFVRQTAKSGAKNDGCFRTGVHLPFQKSCCFLYFL